MKPVVDPENWLPLKEVAHALRLSRHTVVRLSEDVDPHTRLPYLCAWRPSPGTLLISRQSLERYCEATRCDPEFWSARRQIRCSTNSEPVTPIRRSRATSDRTACPRKKFHGSTAIK